MKKTALTLKVGILFLLINVNLDSRAAIVRAIQNGEWENSATWQQGTLPNNGDSIVIPAGKTVEVTTVADYSAGAPMKLNIVGELTFQTGKKLTFPSGSIITIQVAAYITPGNGGGNSNIINIGLELVWSAGIGPITGYLVLPSSPLPVELIDFKARAKNETIFISWETATEVNNDYFDVERSSDGRFFETLGKVDGHGTSATGYKYSFSDAFPKRGNNYYRLKQVDFDNKTIYSHALLCRFKTSATETVQIFPNPSKGEFFLSIPAEEEIMQVDVMIADASANIIYQNTLQNIPGSKGLQVTNREQPLKPGIYFVTVTINEEPLRKQLVVY